MVPLVAAERREEGEGDGKVFLAAALLSASQFSGSFSFLSFFFFFGFLPFLGLFPRHMEVPRLGVESELQLPAYPRATATRDPSHVCSLHHSSWQRRILNPLSEARD